jgi:hypothetical protein
MNEERKCLKCKEVINPLRLKALPTAKTCVECSTTGAKRGVPMMYGEKDHTYTDIVIMEPEEFDRFEKLNNQKSTFDTLDKTELNTDGDDDMSVWDITLLDGLEDM